MKSPNANRPGSIFSSAKLLDPKRLGAERPGPNTFGFETFLSEMSICETPVSKKSGCETS